MDIREARPRDILRFSKFVMPRYVGMVVEDGGEFRGLVAVVWGEKNRPFLVFEITDAIRAKPHFLHRGALRFMAMVAGDFPVIYTQASNAEATSTRWLKRLGFEETDEILGGERVFKWQQSSEHLEHLAGPAVASAPSGQPLGQ